MTAKDDELMEALTGADPARTDLPPAKGSIRYTSIREAAMKSDTRPDRHPAARPTRSTTPRWYRRRPLLAAAGFVVLAGAITATMLLTGGPAGIAPISPAQAKEAVKQAAVDTAAVGESGVIETVLLGLVSTNDGAQAATGAEPEMVRGAIVSRTFAWNGDAFALSAGAGEGPYELRYVQGRFYEKGYSVPGNEEWLHRPEFDDGAGYDPGEDAVDEAFVPAEWLESYHSALVGSGLMDLIESMADLEAASTENGGTAYTGTVAAAKLSAASLGLSGPPFAGQPLDKLLQLDPASAVEIEVLVGSSGLIEQAQLSYELEGAPFTYRVNYSRLGSAPAIEAPEGSRTVATDAPAGTGGD